MQILTYTDARQNLASTMDKVVHDREETVITRTGRESVVMVSQTEWDAIQSTLHLLSSPQNASRLREAIQDLNSGAGKERELSSEPDVRTPRVE